jgi:hypothetical protein
MTTPCSSWARRTLWFFLLVPDWPMTVAFDVRVDLGEVEVWRERLAHAALLVPFEDALMRLVLPGDAAKTGDRELPRHLSRTHFLEPKPRARLAALAIATIELLEAPPTAARLRSARGSSCT